MKAYSCFVGIILMGKIKGLPGRIHIFNIYAPYRDRISFWEKLVDSGILVLDSLLMAVDLILTIGLDAICGDSYRLDPIANKLKDIIFDYNLVDIFPPRLAPTWNNGRMEDMHIGKRLDRFLLHEPLIEMLGYTLSGIINSFISDHRAIILIWNMDDLRMGVPFKFNRVWLEDLYFVTLVKDFYTHYESHEISPMVVMFETLQPFKGVFLNGNVTRNTK